MNHVHRIVFPLIRGHISPDLKMLLQNQDILAIFGQEVSSGLSSDTSTDYYCVENILICHHNTSLFLVVECLVYIS